MDPLSAALGGVIVRNQRTRTAPRDGARGRNLNAVLLEPHCYDHRGLHVSAGMGRDGLARVWPIGLVGMCLWTGDLQHDRSLRFTAASLFAPFKYTAIVWVLLLGYIFWGESPTPVIWLGTARFDPRLWHRSPIRATKFGALNYQFSLPEYWTAAHIKA